MDENAEIKSERVSDDNSYKWDWRSEVDIQEKFSEEAKKILGECKVGCVGDGYGGKVFYAYQPPPTDNQSYIESLIKSNFRENETDVAIKLIAEAQRTCVHRVPKKLREALDDLTIESLYPIYERIGRKFITWTTDRWHRFSRGIEMTLVDGILVRKRLKEDPGIGLTNEEWPKERLEDALRDAESWYLKRPEQVTLGNIARIINKHWAIGEKLSEASLQKLLERRGIAWKQRKQEMIKKLKPTK